MAARFLAAAPVSAPAPDPYVVPARFFPIPRELGVVAVFDALVATPDGKVYMGTSTYNHPAQILELDPGTGAIRVVVDLGKALPQDDSLAITQSKIHTFLELSADGNVIYFGTHTGEPQPMSEHARDYPGGHFMAYDRRTGAVTDFGLGRPRESLMCVTLDEPRGRLYGMTYPRGHLLECDLATRKVRDHGKASLSSYSNPWVAWDGKVYFASRLDEFSRFDPDTGALEILPIRLPEVEGEPQSLFFGCFSAQSRDRKRLYGVVLPSHHAVEWDLANPPGSFRYLCGPIPGGTVFLSRDEDALYWPELGKYDFAAGKQFALGRLKAGDERLAGVWAMAAAPSGKLYLGGLRAVREVTPGDWRSQYGRWDVCGFWEYDPAVEPGLLKEANREPPVRPAPRKTPDSLKGFADLNAALPYGESSLRALRRLPDGALLGATIGRRSHLVLIEGDPPEVRDLGSLPDGEFPAFDGLALDRTGGVWLATIGDLETIYRRAPTPAGKLYRVDLDETRTKAELQALAEPFPEDGIYALAMNAAGTELAGVTFPGGRLFSMALPDGQPVERAVLTRETRPPMEDSCSYTWMQVRVGRVLAYGADGTLYAGADSADLVVLAPGAAAVTRHTLPLPAGFRWSECEVRSLAVAPDSRIFIGTVRGYLMAFDPATRTFRNLGRPARQGQVRALTWAGDRLYGLCGEPYGTTVLFGYGPDGSYILPAIPAPQGYELQFYNDSFETLLAEPDGGLWLGGAGRMTGVLKMKP
jgi:outer membrane protein assembly factor BamB